MQIEGVFTLASFRLGPVELWAPVWAVRASENAAIALGCAPKQSCSKHCVLLECRLQRCAHLLCKTLFKLLSSAFKDVIFLDYLLDIWPKWLIPMSSAHVAFCKGFCLTFCPCIVNTHKNGQIDQSFPRQTSEMFSGGWKETAVLLLLQFALNCAAFSCVHLLHGERNMWRWWFVTQVGFQLDGYFQKHGHSSQSSTAFTEGQ